jgi:hypothetical protein
MIRWGVLQGLLGIVLCATAHYAQAQVDGSMHPDPLKVRLGAGVKGDPDRLLKHDTSGVWLLSRPMKRSIRIDRFDPEGNVLAGRTMDDKSWGIAVVPCNAALISERLFVFATKPKKERDGYHLLVMELDGGTLEDMGEPIVAGEIIAHNEKMDEPEMLVLTSPDESRMLLVNPVLPKNGQLPPYGNGVLRFLQFTDGPMPVWSGGVGLPASYTPYGSQVRQISVTNKGDVLVVMGVGAMSPIVGFQGKPSPTIWMARCGPRFASTAALVPWFEEATVNDLVLLEEDEGYTALGNYILEKGGQLRGMVMARLNDDLTTREHWMKPFTDEEVLELHGKVIGATTVKSMRKNNKTGLDLYRGRWAVKQTTGYLLIAEEWPDGYLPKSWQPIASPVGDDLVVTWFDRENGPFLTKRIDRSLPRAGRNVRRNEVTWAEDGTTHLLFNAKLVPSGTQKTEVHHCEILDDGTIVHSRFLTMEGPEWRLDPDLFWRKPDGGVVVMLRNRSDTRMVEYP